MILDINGSCWFEVFEEKEREEIYRFRYVEMPSISVEIETYLQGMANLDPPGLYAKVDSDVFFGASHFNWIQKPYRDTPSEI